ncbi:hypothetical protein ACGK9U_02980 [Mariniflexile sp. HNIBRBA6329]|uniref:hypothetical protein n=1 Tax=Mariniflexile sp. HNIBRBA6329 TaxID=3373088 RepID=UPI003745B66D
MKNILLILCFTPLLLTSCFRDGDDDFAIVGVWQLSAMNVEDGFDINNDGTISSNLLNEIDCINNETLVFESNGVVTSNSTFNPHIKIALLDGASDEYIFNVVCDEEGVISFATTYAYNSKVVVINESIATFANNQLSRVFEDAIQIYNEDFTEVVTTKDLTLVYTKQ